MSVATWPILLLAASGFFAGIPLIDVVNGLIQKDGGTSLLATGYKSLVILLLGIAIFSRKIPKSAFKTTIAIWFFLLLQLTISGNNLDSRINPIDLTVIARGPLLFSFIWLFLHFFSKSHIPRIADIYFITTWWTVTISILFMKILGFSSSTYTGSESFGAKGSYIAANEITIVYMLSWWYITVKKNNNRSINTIYTVSTLAMLIVIGTKSGFVIFLIVALWHAMIIKNISPLRVFLLFLLAATIGIILAEEIFITIGPFLVGWDRLSFFSEKYSPSTALTGGRFLLLPEILSIFLNFDPIQILFGLGFKAFWNDTDDSSIESDILDLYGGGGLISIIIFYGFLVRAMNLTLKKPRLAHWGGIIMAIVLYSIFVGHIAFAATPIISVATILSVLFFENRNENRNNPVLVQQSQVA